MSAKSHPLRESRNAIFFDTFMFLFPSRGDLRDCREGLREREKRIEQERKDRVDRRRNLADAAKLCYVHFINNGNLVVASGLEVGEAEIA
ncbi:hypothetical protein TNCV_4194091 [Trichonephila clavipes]|nr:hypothetical protein TNCV_4194091 [Trichonephila clavipes]